MLVVAEHFEKSDTGRARRANEDSYLARAPLFVVADGMGGAQAGEVASRIAVDTLERGLAEGEAPVQELLAARIEEANRAIHELSRTESDRAGMGTTITAVYVGAEEAAVAHVGDSRAYLWRAGELRRLTDDHSLVEELLRQGKLTAAEATDHPQKSIITRALGPEPVVEVDRQTVVARDGDVFLLCSDGLTTMIGEDAIVDVLASARGLREAGQALVRAANDAGGRDNITVVLFRLAEAGDRGQPAEQPTGTWAAGEARAHRGTGAATATAAAVATAGAAPVEPRRPRPRASPGAPPRRRGLPGWAKALVVAAVLLTPVLVGGYVATQAVYFVGADGDGRITLYRGMPWDGPAGLRLYSPAYVSGVTVAEIPAGQRRRLLDHELRSHDDAADLVRRLERGELSVP